MKILNTIKNFNQQGKKILESVGSVDYREPAQTELSDIIADYQVIVVGLGLNINKEIIDNASNLEVIATPTTGLDHIDVEYARQKGIEVISLKGEDEFLRTITGTAELAFGLMIALLRKIPQASEDVKKGGWSRDNFVGRSLSGKTLGIIGLGRLGTMMAKYAKVFGMNVIAYDSSSEEEDLEALLKKSDIISIHLPLNKETEGMIGESEFTKMKPEAYLINTSRGKIVDEDVLLRALRNKKIAGYATDVLSGEINFFPRDVSRNVSTPDSKLINYAKEHDNVLITPHIGGMTREARAATDIFITNKIKKYLFK